ncbi:MAG: oxaloacetate decarboxylase [Clostridia bacterium]|nr:oxaloacetate decarboxylase [Clostridia bacterium]
MNINLWNFVENLKYMGMGMLGIIAVIGVIILITVVLSKATQNKED